MSNTAPVMEKYLPNSPAETVTFAFQWNGEKPAQHSDPAWSDCAYYEPSEAGSEPRLQVFVAKGKEVFARPGQWILKHLNHAREVVGDAEFHKRYTKAEARTIIEVDPLTAAGII